VIRLDAGTGSKSPGCIRMTLEAALCGARTGDAQPNANAGPQTLSRDLAYNGPEPESAPLSLREFTVTNCGPLLNVAARHHW
jgi:hypothetical protein